MATFGKRFSKNTAETRQQAEPPLIAKSSKPFIETILVRESDVEFYLTNPEELSLLEAVSEFVDKMLNLGFYEWDEIPSCAGNAHSIYEYIGQVENGGHSQFVSNYRGGFDGVVKQLICATKECGATDYLNILNKFDDWQKNNPEERNQQTGFAGGRAEFLDALDDSYRELEKDNRLGRLLCEHIKNWPILRVVKDETYRDEITKLVNANPKREERKAKALLRKLHYRMTDYKLVALGLVGARNKSRPCVLLSAVSGTKATIGDQAAELTRIDTTGPTLYCELTASKVNAYSIDEEPNLSSSFDPQPIGPEAYIHLPDGTKKARCVSVVDTNEIDQIINLAQLDHAAFIMDILLRKADMAHGSTYIVPDGIAGSATVKEIRWMVYYPGRPCYALTAPSGGVLLLVNSNDPIAFVDDVDLAIHSKLLNESPRWG